MRKTRENTVESFRQDHRNNEPQTTNNEQSIFPFALQSPLRSSRILEASGRLRKVPGRYSVMYMQGLVSTLAWNTLSRHMTRRNFLKTTGAGAVALAVPKPSLFAADEDKPLRV